MDAKTRRRRRESSISLRENRWSMSSQRLEQIVAELMKPISDVRTSFDKDISGLLEEYLTEAGLRALAADEEAEREGFEPPPVNFPQMALILAQSTENWGKKVDLLYSNIMRFEDELRERDTEAEPDAASGPAGRRRRRTGSPSPSLSFAPIVLESHAGGGGTRRDLPAAPPPTLPRMYVELEPRAAVQDERALRDYSHEVIGALPDYSVTWRLLDGLLVEDLETRLEWSAPLPLCPLSPLQPECAPAPAPAPLGSPSASPLPASPLPASPRPISPPPPPPAAASTPLPLPPPAPPAALRRKRRSTVHVEDLLAGSVKICMSAELRSRLVELGTQEYSVPARWVRRVLAHRKHAILAARRTRPPRPPEFYGFDSPWTDIGGFVGWAAAESAGARAAAALARRRHAAAAPRDLSEDDGFFERSSSLEPSDGLEAVDVDGDVDGDMDAWKAAAVTTPRRRLHESVPLDLAALRRDVTRALPPPPAALPWRSLLHATADKPESVSRVFLSVLMQATSGEVEIVQGAALALGDFEVRATPSVTSPPRPPPPPPPPPGAEG